LLRAAERDWSEVEPAIFGTLLENALNAKERHSLGAHFTPRAYVERLVRPTIEEPLRAEWLVVRSEVRKLLDETKEKAALGKLEEFHARLCKIRVLDPACGTGNFLYVALDLMKQLEGEVLEEIARIAGKDQQRLEMERVTVSPAQFLGIEKSPWAAEIAELVLWIGFLRLQWRLRGSSAIAVTGDSILKDYENIECRDAVLDWDEIRHDTSRDRPDPTRRLPHNITGDLVPDRNAKISHTLPDDSRFEAQDLDAMFKGKAKTRAQEIRTILETFAALGSLVILAPGQFGRAVRRVA
jgi:hypothetical protein